MEKSFDEITVSSLSDLQLGSSSEYQNHNTSDQVQQAVQRSSSAAAGGNENNLNRQKRSSSKQQQQHQQQTVFNPSRHLDVWLANAIRGLENANSGGGGLDSDLLDSPTLLKGGGFGEPLSLPPNLGYLDVPNSSSSPTTGIFSPTQQQQLQQQHQLQQSQQQFLLNSAASPYLLQRAGYATSFPSSEGIEFASLPPRISHNQQQQQQQYQQYLLQQQGRRAGSQGGQNQLNQSASSFQDLLNAQRSMTDPYINDSSDNESKNGSCTNTKSKLESAEALLADLNLLNSSSGNNGNSNNGTGNGNINTNTTNTNGIGNNGLNGSSAATTTGNNSTNTNSNNGSNSNNLVLVLLKEISKLHETNKKICRNLHETKVEMEALKHAPHWGLSHRRDSISGLSTNSQPIGVGHQQHMRGGYNSSSIGGGLHSPAPTYHSQGNYTPGIVSDVVREIREVSRVREEALMDRMKTLIEERSWAVNETNFRLLKETEDMKKSIHSVRSEMHQFMDRMLKLENEVLTLKGQLSHVQQQQQQVQQVQHQNSFVLRERDSYGQGLGVSSAAAKFRRNSMHLNYGRINSTDEFYGNNFNDLSNELRFSNGGGSNSGPSATSRINATGSAGSGNSKFGENNFTTSSSSSSSALMVNGGGFGGKMRNSDPGDNLVVMHVVEDVDDELGPDGGVNSSASEANQQVLALEKDALKLRRELQDALASKQESESRITALESIVSTLKEQVPPAALTASTAQQHPHHHSQLLLTTSSALPAGTSSASNNSYFRNSGSPQQVPGTVSPKLQKAAQVQSLASPSSKQQLQQNQHQHQQHFQQRFLDHSTIPSGVMNVTGPVTDL